MKTPQLENQQGSFVEGQRVDHSTISIIASDYSADSFGQGEPSSHPWISKLSDLRDDLEILESHCA